MANEQTRGMTDFATGNSDTGTGTGTSVRDRAREAVNQAKDRAGEQLESRFTSTKSRAAETLSGVAQAFLSSSENLRQQNQEGASRAIERAAEGVERFANYLQHTDVDEVVDQVHEFARRQPAAFIGGAFALGFLASRFIKATSPGDQRYLPSGTERGYTSGEGHTGASDTAYSTDRGYVDTRSGGGLGGGYGNTGDTSGSLGYGAGLSTTGGGTTGGGYSTTGSSDVDAPRVATEDGDGSPGLRGQDRTGGTDVGSR